MMELNRMSNPTFALLNPKGWIAIQQHSLIMLTLSMALIVAILFFTATFLIVWRYRAGKNHAYSPNWDPHKTLGIVWWAIPATIILFLSIVTWTTTHLLDPRKPLPVAGTPMTIQVVALQWKWLFIYPREHIATVNYVVFPENTPITFQLTAQAPMNSFWIPQLGGQMYAMEGMVNTLHLMANETGEYKGSDAEISGAGFADMRFTAKSTSQHDFDNWVTSVKQSGGALDQTTYDALASPSEKTPITMYASVKDNLFNDIMMKYLMPGMEMH
jgi:cytochrome o ubiquinol oxidase subunit 2